MGLRSQAQYELVSTGVLSIDSIYMKARYIFILLVTVVIGTPIVQALQNNDQPTWKDYVDLKEYMQPFWRADTIYDEIIQPIKDGSNMPEGRLLFKAKKVISVRDSYLQKEYKKGKDWKYSDGKIVLPAHTSIPYFTKDELYFTENKGGDVSIESNRAGHYLIFSEDGLLQSKQLAVTYVKDKSARWQGLVPLLAEKQLPSTLSALKTGKPVNILFYGNSIESGYSSSIKLNQSPYLPTWAELTVLNLRSHYRGAIKYKNKSMGGTMALWGYDNAATLLNPEQPDLVVIGFGMNDGTAKIDPKVFIKQIKGIMDTVKAAHPACEFIVVSTLLPNPDAPHNQLQKSYQQPILDLQKAGVAVADLTAIHEELLRHKPYQDMTGNNVNHPNDYMARWYAQVVSALLIP